MLQALSWAKLILAIIGIADTLVRYLISQRYITQGEEKAIAEAALALLQQTSYGKTLADRVDTMSDPDVDQLLLDLADPNKKP